MISSMRPAFAMLLVLTVLTGLFYPAIVTALGQVCFHHAANGSMIVEDGRTVGSELVGQPFYDPQYFWGRPSASSPFPYAAKPSGGSNLGPQNASMLERVKARIEQLRASDPANTTPIPVDLVTASGSGLDPHISIAAARWQANRVARERGIDPGAVNAQIDSNAEGRLFGILGEPRVNVLRLNRALAAAAAVDRTK